MLTGIILTDTKSLAQVLNESQEKVIATIFRYIDKCTKYIDWQLIDLAKQEYTETSKNDWHSCASILNDYYYGLGLNGRYNCPLFIIGGHNVVPMPTIENPLMMNLGEEYLYSDMLYCYESTDEVHWEYIVNEQPRFAVGRLPLPFNQDKSNINKKDLVTYLDTCVKLTEQGVITKDIFVVSAESLKNASIELMINLQQSTDKLILSPPLDLAMEDCKNEFLKEDNFSIFCLHGSENHEHPEFIGENIWHSYYPLAVHPITLQEESPQIFNTVACYGARYIDYSPNESILLTALANGTMLYCGACNPAIGSPSKMSLSVAMICLYSFYLCKGYPAGMALMKAKQDFYHKSHESEGDTFDMYTILEFNLFGCPILSLIPQIDFESSIYLQKSTKTKSTYKPIKAKPLFSQIIKNEDMRLRVKMSFEKKLKDLSKLAEEAIQEYLQPDSLVLEQIYELSKDNKETGHRFVYTKSLNGAEGYETKYFVEIDTAGKILPITCTI